MSLRELQQKPASVFGFASKDGQDWMPIWQIAPRTTIEIPRGCRLLLAGARRPCGPSTVLHLHRRGWTPLPDKVGYVVEVAVGGFDDDLWRLAENMTKGCLSPIACRTEAIRLVGRFRSRFSIRQLFWCEGLPEIKV
ncbi:MAG TPA: hypothetical protein VJ783_19335 [Pirellulales bacterium]|nr:hypothetical protein [Pirellulales bacterium]